MVNGGPDLNLLVALCALLEEANVTRAGERIGVGQSTMSTSLARLRVMFQDELLVRVGREYELTPLARQILPRVQRALPLAAQALGQEEVFEPSSTRRVFTLQLSDFGVIELRPLFRLAQLAAPGIRFDFQRLPLEPMDAERDLLGHDFIIGPPGVGIDVESVELFRDEYVVILDRNNPLVLRGEVSFDDLDRGPFIRCDFGGTHLTPAERRMRELDLRPQVRVTTSSLLAIPHIVRGTELIGVVPRRLVTCHGAVSGTVALPTPFEPVELIERMWWHPVHRADAGHSWLRDLTVHAVGSGALAA